MLRVSSKDLNWLDVLNLAFLTAVMDLGVSDIKTAHRGFLGAPIDTYLPI